MPPSTKTSALARDLQKLPWQQSFTELPQAFWSPARSVPLPNPRPVLVSEDCARSLGLDPDSLRTEAAAAVLCGQTPVDGPGPVATVYAGHQFGGFTPRLGDGRAFLLGELPTERGLTEVQLKGAGPTEYARGFDGLAALRSSVREFLASEAMHALGVPSTRALALYRHERPVYREQVEPGAVLARVAPSHLRIGHFEYFAARRMSAERDRLIDAALRRSNLEPSGGAALLFWTCAEASARLVAAWQSLGFVHAVLNTDNTSIYGLTIDYGPFGFVEETDFAWTPNHSDPSGRYAYGEQPGIMRWNLERFADALGERLAPAERQAALSRYDQLYASERLARFRAKLGLPTEEPGDESLITELLIIMARSRLDFSRLFRALSDEIFHLEDGLRPGLIARYGVSPQALLPWLEGYAARLGPSRFSSERRSAMRRRNPRVVPRTWVCQRAIEAAERGQQGELERIYQALIRPYADDPESRDLESPAPPWLRCSELSCSA